MAKRLSLDELQLKPMPNKKQKTGVEIFFEKKESVDEENPQDAKEELQMNESEETLAVPIKIIERIDVNFDRASLYTRMMSKNVFSIKKPIPISQVPEDLVESAK